MRAPAGELRTPPPIRELRDLPRDRKALLQDRTREANRLHTILQDAGIKLATVATDILGVSGRAMLPALVTGTTDPAGLADLARGKLRAKLPALCQALTERFRGHHAFLVTQLLAHLDYLDETIVTLSDEIGGHLVPFAEPMIRLTTIPGVKQRTVEHLLAEIGADLTPFPSAGYLARWAGLGPGNNESAGKRKSGKMRDGNPRIRRALCQSA